MAMTIPILILLKAAIAVTVLHGGPPGPDPDLAPKVSEIPACHDSGVCDRPHKVVKVACSEKTSKLPDRCDPSDRVDDLPAPPEPDPGALSPTPEPEPDDGADHPADDDRVPPAPQERDDDARHPGEPEVPEAEDDDRHDDDRRPRDPEVPGAEDDDGEPEPPTASEPQLSVGFGAQR